MKSKIMLVIAMSLLFIITGCGSKEDANESTPPIIEVPFEPEQEETNTQEQSGEISTEEGSIPSEESPDDQVGEQPVPEVQYYVNDKYYIKPVNEDDNQKVVLLTIDDSPAGDSTYEILEILDKYNAKAIWFVNGYYANRNRDLLKEIHDKGHLIGNHTWWHKNLKELDAETTREEIVSINDLVEEVTGVRPTYFRAPFGVYTDEAKKVLKEENMQYMNWTWGSLDWELDTSEAIAKNVIENIHKGANILFHDKRITAEALDTILKTLQEAGYTFVLPTEVRVQE